MTAGAEERLIMALPNGRILAEVMPLLRRIGVEPEPAFEDPEFAPVAVFHQRSAARPDPGA